jgi:acyl-CoA thioesterase-2
VSDTDTDTHPFPDASPGDQEPDGGPDGGPEGWRKRVMAGLLDVLDLDPCPGQADDVFLGRSQPQRGGRVFGGQVLAQSLVAAQRTVSPDRPVHSMHGYFLRAGDTTDPITFAVERLRDGRSFSVRRVHALQFGRPILSTIASFQLPAAGLDHAEPMPDVPPPQSLPSLSERYPQIDDTRLRYWQRQRPPELRHVQRPIHVEAPDPGREQAVEPVLRAHGLTWSHPRLRVASLDHAVWWHRPVRADQWLLYVQTSPSASGARGLSVGRIYAADGTLAASISQEGMFRIPAEDPAEDPADDPADDPGR